MKFKNINRLNTELRNNYKVYFVLVFVFGAAISQSFAQYKMRKHSINNGGGTLSGGEFVLKSSIGQTDASSELSAVNYKVNGGFWHKNNDLIFKNDFE